jgi:hypothetical protein
VVSWLQTPQTKGKLEWLRHLHDQRRRQLAMLREFIEFIEWYNGEIHEAL